MQCTMVYMQNNIASACESIFSPLTVSSLFVYLSNVRLDSNIKPLEDASKQPTIPLYQAQCQRHIGIRIGIGNGNGNASKRKYQNKL